MSGQIYFSLLNPAITFAFGAVFLLFWRRWQAQKHLFVLSFAFFLAAAGFVILDLAALGSDPIGRLASNGAIVASILLACCAALMRKHIAAPRKLFAAIVVVGFGLFGWYLFGDDSISARIVIMGATLAALSLVTVLRLLRAPTVSAADRLIIIAAIIGTMLSLIRPALAVMGVLAADDAPSFQQSTYWISVQAFSPILTGMIAILFLAAMSMDTFEQLKSDANHDYLTGLLNRRGFEAAISAALAGAGRSRPALLMADIDDFKRINDRFGHKVGDQVIAAIARALAEHGGARFAARVGGEEFALYYDDCDNADLQHHAEAIRLAVRDAKVTGIPTDYPLTISIGLHGRSDGETLSEMLIESDRALYKAKTSGKDRAVISRVQLRSLDGRTKLA